MKYAIILLSLFFLQTTFCQNDQKLEISYFYKLLVITPKKQQLIKCDSLEYNFGSGMYYNYFFKSNRLYEPFKGYDFLADNHKTKYKKKRGIKKRLRFEYWNELNYMKDEKAQAFIHAIKKMENLDYIETSIATGHIYLHAIFYHYKNKTYAILYDKNHHYFKFNKKISFEKTEVFLTKILMYN